MKKLLVTIAIAILSTTMIFSPTKAISLDQILKDITKLAPLVLSDEKVGNLLSNGLEDKYTLSTNANYQNRLQRVSADIVGKMNNLDTNYQFFCLASNDFNAFSCYGGKIYATEGLMRETQNSDAELSAVLRHEIAHNKMGHNKKALKTFKTTYAIQLAGLNKNLPQLLKSAAEAMLAKRSRGFELEADKFSTENAISASDLRGNIAVFRRIEAEHKLEQEKYGNDITKQAYARLFATHPEPSLRAELAEDALFQKEYGNTFKAIASANTFNPLSSNNLLGNSPVVIAHPGQWKSVVCRTPEYANAYGFFNPMSKPLEKIELDMYCDWLNRGCPLALTCDNDSHFPSGSAVNYGYTYIEAPDSDPKTLKQAIKDGRTYASMDGINIINENFRFGRQYTKTDKVVLTFTLDLSLTNTLAPKVQVIRNGKVVATLEKENSKLERHATYRFEDKPSTGRYWYALYIFGQLLTSPATFDVMNGVATASNTPATWQKGIIHSHSTYSDGYSSLKQIWNKCQLANLDFVFMTDHAEKFTDANEYNKYVSECKSLSEAMIPGVEYPMNNTKELRHLLVLGLYNYIPYEEMAEEQFFGEANVSKTLIIQGPFHLGDDIPNSEIIEEATFDYSPTKSTVKLRVKGTPRKDPILWINRHEIGRIVTTDDKWHWYEFNVPAEFLFNGQNLFHIEAFIPNRWQSFDDCEVADVYILPH